LTYTDGVGVWHNVSSWMRMNQGQGQGQCNPTMYTMYRKNRFIMTLYRIVKYLSPKLHSKFDTLAIAGMRNQVCKARLSVRLFVTDHAV